MIDSLVVISRDRYIGIDIFDKSTTSTVEARIVLRLHLRDSALGGSKKNIEVD